MEVILNINVYLCAQDRWALMRTCRGFHHHLEHTLWQPGPDSSRAEQWLRSTYKSILQRFRISQLDSSHAGALLWALTRKDCEVARKALQFRAVRTEFVESLLRPAIVLSSCAKLLDLLLGYMPNPEDVINHTRGYAGPLMFSAATSGTLAIFETLLQHGADPNVQKNGYPIVLALSSSVGEAIAPLLIRHGADIPVHVHGWSPLKYAAVHDRAFLLPLLSADGVDIHAVDSQDNTHRALCLAVSHDAVNCVRVFLDGGSDPMTRAIDDDYAFLLGKFNHKRQSIWRLFLDHGVPVDVRCLQSMTLLMWAALHGDRELVELILQRGADATLEDDDGRTAVDCALQNRTWCRKECLDTAAYIIEAGCRQKQGEAAGTRWCAPWRTAVSVGQDDLLHHVLKRNGHDHCTRDLRGQTLLMVAAQSRAGRAARSYGFAYPWERCRREAMAQTDDGRKHGPVLGRVLGRQVPVQAVSAGRRRRRQHACRRRAVVACRGGRRRRAGGSFCADCFCTCGMSMRRMEKGGRRFRTPRVVRIKRSCGRW